MTVEDIAKIENRKPETVRRWIRNGTLSQHGYDVVKFDSKKEGYILRTKEEPNIDDEIRIAMTMLEYYQRMVFITNNKIAELKLLKASLEES